jgi:protein gp37
MGEKTEIAWTDSTLNPWIGCQKVSAGCDNCYAETLMDKRYHKVEWGPHGERKRTSASNWRQPITWNKHHAAFQAQHGRRQRVFCASLADVFDNKAPVGAREDLFQLIRDTPELDWLLLTKRPENISKMLPADWSNGYPGVWLGTTCEDQSAYDRRWPILASVPAAVRFISYEPALGDIWLPSGDVQPDWLICGGESGSGHRYMKPEWAMHAAIQCDALGIAFFMKQMAGKKPIPADLMIREFPQERAV